MNRIVELNQVSRAFGRIQALERLDLRLETGEVLGLLGHNGAGKSTTIKLILGILAATAGEVRVLGEDPRGRGAGRLRMATGYLPENVSFYDNLTGREVLQYFARLKRVPTRAVGELLERVGLREAAHRRVRTYSKGMRQRLGLAQALLGHPRLLLLDEPTVGLDPMATRDVYNMIDTLRDRGTGVILCSHVLPGVERHIDRVAILGRGRLLASGTIDALREQAGLPLQIRVRITGANGAQRQALGANALETRVEDDGTIVLSVRPECKMAALQALLAAPGVEDLSVETPTLETLYAHFDGLDGRREQPHA